MIDKSDMKPGFVYKMNDGQRFQVEEITAYGLFGQYLDKVQTGYLTKDLLPTSVEHDRRVNLEKPYVTRSGLPVRVLATDVSGSHPVVGIVSEGDEQRVVRYLASGRCYSTCDDADDLMDAKPGLYQPDEVVEGERLGYWDKYHYREPLDESNHTVWSNGRSRATVRDDKDFFAVPSDRIRKLA